MSSFLTTDSFEAGVGNVPNMFAKFDNNAMLVSASHGYGVSFKITSIQAPVSPAPSKSPAIDTAAAYDRWTFLKKGADGRTLHDKISEKIKQDMDAQSAFELEQQEVAFEKAFRNWVVTADFGVKEPNVNDYPQLKEHLNKVQTTESGITKMVLDGLTPDEVINFSLESEPLKPGQTSQQLSAYVVKRITEQTQRFLDTNQFSPREHNRT